MKFKSHSEFKAANDAAHSRISKGGSNLSARVARGGAKGKREKYEKVAQKAFNAKLDVEISANNDDCNYWQG